MPRFIAFCWFALFLAACADSSDRSAAVVSGELRPSKDTPTYCYIAQHADLREGIALTYDPANGALLGTGEGWLYDTDRAYNIEISAHCPDAQKGCILKIRRQFLDDGSIHHNQENWYLQSQPQQWRSQPIERWHSSAPSLPLRYYRIHCFNAAFKDDKLWDDIHIFNEGFAPAQRGDKYALVDTNLRERLPAQYIELGFINEGTMVFAENIGSTQLRGVIDTAGKILLPAQYTMATPFYSGAAWAMPFRGKGWQLFDKTGKALTDDGFSAIHFSDLQPNQKPIKEGLSAVERQGKWGFLDTAGKTAIPFKYEFARNFQNGRAEVALDGKTLYIDQKGNTITE